MQVKDTDDFGGGDDWEYVEEGPAEIIWKGNEIIVKKKRVKVPKRLDQEVSPLLVSHYPLSPIISGLGCSIKFSVYFSKSAPVAGE